MGGYVLLTFVSWWQFCDISSLDRDTPYWVPVKLFLSNCWYINSVFVHVHFMVLLLVSWKPSILIMLFSMLLGPYWPPAPPIQCFIHWLCACYKLFLWLWLLLYDFSFCVCLKCFDSEFRLSCTSSPAGTLAADVCQCGWGINVTSCEIWILLPPAHTLMFARTAVAGSDTMKNVSFVLKLNKELTP